MYSVAGDNINEVITKSCKLLKSFGTTAPSRNGDVIELIGVDYTLNEPRARHLNLKGRKNNPFGTISEVLWVMSGETKLDGVMALAVPRCYDFSDDGKTWRAGYSSRLWGGSPGFTNQILECARTLVMDPGSRRAVISLWSPEFDNYTSCGESRDFSCNNLLYLWIRDNKLHLRVVARGLDQIWGIGNCNIPEFTILQEVMLCILNKTTDLNLTLGKYHHTVNNLHCYDFTKDQMDEIIARDQDYETGRLEDLTLFHNNNTIDVDEASRVVFTKFQELFKYMDFLSTHNMYPTEESMEELFNQLDIPVKCNSLWFYFQASCKYLYGKRTGTKACVIGVPTTSDYFKGFYNKNRYCTVGS